MEEKIKALYSDKEFVDKLASVRTFEEASVLFAEYGVKISATDLAEIAKETAVSGEEYLDEGALEQVSGGGILLGIGCLVGGYVIGRIIERVTRY